MNRLQSTLIIGIAVGLPTLLFGLLIGPMLTSAQTNRETSVIMGCVMNSTGALRIVSRNETCRRGESLLDWNRQGPIGATGVQGPQGLQGPPGPSGAGQTTIRSYRVAPGYTDYAEAHCLPGEFVTGGGWKDWGTYVSPHSNYPSDSLTDPSGNTVNGWVFRANGNLETTYVYAICTGP